MTAPFEAHWSDVFRFALAWTNGWAEAEDLAQEAYLRLWNHRTRFQLLRSKSGAAGQCRLRPERRWSVRCHACLVERRCSAL